MTNEENLTRPEEVAVGEIVVTPSESAEADAFAAEVGKNWGMVLSVGLVLIGFGVAVMVWPQATVGIIALLLGIALIVSGLFSVVGSFTRPDRTTGTRVLLGISGVLSIVLGALALSGITEAIWILALMIGFGWIFSGITDLVLGFSAKGAPGRGLAIAGGILGIIAGAVVILWPAKTLLVLAWIGGLALVVLGLVQVILALRLRKVSSAADLQQVVNR